MGMDAKTAILEQKTALGIEFGSTRIKAVLVGEDNAPIASGNHEWENRYDNDIWTYTLEDIWNGPAGLLYQEMAADVQGKIRRDSDPRGSHRLQRHDARLYGFDKAGKAPGAVPHLEEYYYRRSMREAYRSFRTSIFPRDGASPICIRQS